MTPRRETLTGGSREDWTATENSSDRESRPSRKHFTESRRSTRPCLAHPTHGFSPALPNHVVQRQTSDWPAWIEGTHHWVGRPGWQYYRILSWIITRSGYSYGDTRVGSHKHALNCALWTGSGDSKERGPEGGGDDEKENGWGMWRCGSRRKKKCQYMDTE